MSSQHSFVLIPSASCSAQVIYFEWEEKHIWKPSLLSPWRSVEASAGLKERHPLHSQNNNFSLCQSSSATSEKRKISSVHCTYLLFTQIIAWYTPHKCDGNSIIVSFTVSEHPGKKSQLHYDVYLQYLFPIELRKVSVFAVYIIYSLNT